MQSVVTDKLVKKVSAKVVQENCLISEFNSSIAFPQGSHLFNCS